MSSHRAQSGSAALRIQCDEIDVLMHGMVEHLRQPRLLEKVFSPKGAARTINVVIDTGFNGEINLTPILIADMGLEWLESDYSELADGSIVQDEVYRAEIE